MCRIMLHIMLFLFLLFIFTSGHVLAAFQPGAQKFVNPDFEQGTMKGWTGQGSGQWGVEQCCGQHETPLWGRGSNPYPSRPQAFTSNTWNGFVSPVAGGSTQLYQSSQVSQGQKYRLSSWIFTSGATAYLERWAPSLGGLIQCASTADTAHTPFSCEFTANATESMAFILEQGYAAGQWAVADDWTLTPIITVPRNLLADTWATLPVPYYVDSTAYVMRTDVAAWSWNNAMGKQMLQRTGNANQRDSIRVYGYYDSSWPAVYGIADYRKDANGVKNIYMNKWWMDAWHSNNYRFGFEARESVIAHEFGHTLALDHIQNECQLMNPYGDTFNWTCNAFKPTSGDVSGMRAVYP